MIAEKYLIMLEKLFLYIISGIMLDKRSRFKQQMIMKAKKRPRLYREE